MSRLRTATSGATTASSARFTRAIGTRRPAIRAGAAVSIFVPCNRTIISRCNRAGERQQLFYLLVGRGEIGERQGHGQRFLAEVLERYLELLAGFHRAEQIRRDRRAGVAASRLAGLDL